MTRTRVFRRLPSCASLEEAIASLEEAIAAAVELARDEQAVASRPAAEDRGGACTEIVLGRK